MARGTGLHPANPGTCGTASPTAWCAQYDEVSLLPAKARAFELPSLSGEESVGIVRFLMDTEQPTPAIEKPPWKAPWPGSKR